MVCKKTTILLYFAKTPTTNTDDRQRKQLLQCSKGEENMMVQ